MECNNAVLNMEVNLQQSRIKYWYTSSVGREINLFNAQATHPYTQEEIIQIALRFTNSLYVSLDLTGELPTCSHTIKFLLANILRMIEVKARSSNTNNEDPASFIAFIRKRFTATLDLFRFLMDPKYRSAPTKGRSDMLLQLSDDSFFMWGESLVFFAETSLKYWKAQCIIM